MLERERTSLTSSGCRAVPVLRNTLCSWVRTVFSLLRDEGLFLGSTSGVNVAAAAQIARRLGPGHTVVTMLCDTGAKYQSRLFNRKWLAEKGLLDASGLAQHVQPVSLTETPRVVDGYPQRLRA